MRSIDTLFTFFFGLVFVGVGAILFAPNYSLVAHGTSAEGRIVNNHRSLAYKGSGYDYAPVIEFTTPDSAVHQFTSKMNTDKQANVGSEIGVLYDPQNPDHATENTVSNLYVFPGIFAGVGVIVWLSALVGFLATKLVRR